MLAILCNEWSIATQIKSNGHLTFQCVIDYWGTRLDEGIPGAILSCNVVVTGGFSDYDPSKYS